jgi:hypothetical protein
MSSSVVLFQVVVLRKYSIRSEIRRVDVVKGAETRILSIFASTTNSTGLVRRIGRVTGLGRLRARVRGPRPIEDARPDRMPLRGVAVE